MADVITRFKVENTQYNKKIGQSKTMLDQLGMSGKGTSQILGQLEKTIGINIASFGKLTAGVGAASAALKVAKDAFFANEQSLDEWGRMVKSSESVYKGFLDSLNTGNISGFLSNIDNIVNAARQAYDALDELATFNAFNQINVEKARTDVQESIAGYREGKGSKEGVKASAEQYKKELADRQKKERDAYIKAVKDVAAQRGVNGDALLKALSGSYGDYESLKGTKMTGEKFVSVGGGIGGPRMVKQSYAANETEKMGEALRRLNDTELQSLQALGAQAQRTGFEIASIDKQVARVLGGNKTGTTTTGGGGRGGKVDDPLAKLKFNANAVDEYEKKLKELRKTFIEVMGEMSSPKLGITRDAILGPSEEGAIDVSGFDPNALKKRMEEQIAQADALANAYTGAASAAASIGQALMSIEDPTAKVAGLIAQAIAQIASSFAGALAADSKWGVWNWIAGAAAGTATMVSTIAAIKSATAGHYANGGIVPGNSRSGDNLIASVNSGELILNHAQQTNLAAQLQANARRDSNDSLGVRVQGDTLYTCLDNYMKRTGKRFSA